MHDRLVQADNQICFRALCAMQQEHARGGARRSGIIALAMQAMRKASRRRHACIDCPYGGQCADPNVQSLISADRVDVHVPVAPITTGPDRR